MKEAQTNRIEFELEIQAPRSIVWETMILNIADWWPRDFRAIANSEFIFEAKPGGSVREENRDGGLEWFSVQALEKERWVSLVGFTAPPWGGPSMTTLRLELDGDGSVTTLRVTDASVGLLGDAKSVEGGWRAIFGGLQELAKARSGDGATQR